MPSVFPNGSGPFSWVALGGNEYASLVSSVADRAGVPPEASRLVPVRA